MEEQIKATKEEAADAVESKKTRYSRKGGFAVRVGESIVEGYKIMYRKLKGFFTKSEEEKSEKKEKKGKKKDKKEKAKKGERKREDHKETTKKDTEKKEENQKEEKSH
jgi:hypothetical protein